MLEVNIFRGNVVEKQFLRAGEFREISVPAGSRVVGKYVLDLPEVENDQELMIARISIPYCVSEENGTMINALLAEQLSNEDRQRLRNASTDLSTIYSPLLLTNLTGQSAVSTQREGNRHTLACEIKDVGSASVNFIGTELNEEYDSIVEDGIETEVVASSETRSEPTASLQDGQNVPVSQVQMPENEEEIEELFMKIQERSMELAAGPYANSLVLTRANSTECPLRTRMPLDKELFPDKTSGQYLFQGREVSLLGLGFLHNTLGEKKLRELLNDVYTPQANRKPNVHFLKFEDLIPQAAEGTHLFLYRVGDAIKVNPLASKKEIYKAIGELREIRKELLKLNPGGA